MTPAERALLLAVAHRTAMLLDSDVYYEAARDMRNMISAVEAEADARLPLGEPCRSCTGHIRENNPIRCAECSPTAHQNYERREDQ